ncbi:glycine cleavage system aminomethyltransferase GcvT [Apibacter sp. HY039]|uniref:glycine cleavage system aminomethyltransferase GcvT n=1 Tax=Apibacter sp. HY039 TaxID=2501476 RepID=UPI000FEBC0B9|nr:glycine cleavage system aminomethyltransferase GcvT [Apibacter sp. HY039]
MKKTVLNQNHVNLGAKMVDFAGFEMPVQYSGITLEHFAVREKAGLFDVSHMGEFSIKGENALPLLQKITSNDVSQLIDGGIQYSTLLNENGGVVDDLLVYKIKDHDYFLVVNASNIEKDWNWISQNNTDEAEMQNLSDDISLLALQGPKAQQILQKLTRVRLADISYYHFTRGTVAGIDEVCISNTGYTGAGGFELYVPNSQAVHLWEKLLEAGKDEGLIPCGLASRDTLRLEKGFCLYGNELSDDTTPIEAGLGWITKTGKGDFLGKEKILNQKNNGVSRKLVGFELLDRGIPRHGYQVFNSEGSCIGEVTSGTMSPIKKSGIGIAYVKPEYARAGSEIFIGIRDKKLKAQTVKMPFV